jgi:hypothetical protein
VDVRWPHHTDAAALHARHEVERTVTKLAAVHPASADDSTSSTKAKKTTKSAAKKKTTKSAKVSQDDASTSSSDESLVGEQAATSATQESAHSASVSGARAVQYVFLSSAMVFGARPDNATPLSDDTRVDTTDSAEPFVSLAATETFLVDFAASHSWFHLTILRPAITVDAAVDAWTYPELAGLGSADALYPDRNVQYVALSDVASAISRVVMDQLSGTFNVSPADWLTVREAREIAGGIPAIDLPASVSKAVVGPARAFGVIRTAPALETYLSNSIVVASDGLRRAGWQPQLTSAEALVASVQASWWSDLSPKRRQELALGAVAAGALGGIALAVGVWLRRRSR